MQKHNVGARGILVNIKDLLVVMESRRVIRTLKKKNPSSSLPLPLPLQTSIVWVVDVHWGRGLFSVVFLIIIIIFLVIIVKRRGVIREREIERVGTFRERVIESECEQLSQRLRLVS